MKERHERETALKGERDLQAKGAADREAALQVRLNLALLLGAALVYAPQLVCRAADALVHERGISTQCCSAVGLLNLVQCGL